MNTKKWLPEIFLVNCAELSLVKSNSLTKQQKLPTMQLRLLLLFSTMCVCVCVCVCVSID